MDISKTVADLRQRIPFLTPRISGERKLEIIPLDPVAAAAIEKNNYLLKYANVVTSQDGEDGVLAEIFRRMGIGRGWCVEFGAWDGKADSNVWDMVHNQGWKAVYIEPDKGAFDTLVESCKGLQDIYSFNEMVSWEGDNTLDKILARTPIPSDFEFLAIDVDGNDFYIWRAFVKYRPRVVMIEFNSFVAPDIYFVKPAEEETKASATLLAVYQLGKSKGYELICAVGGNAIFVRKEDFATFGIEDNRPASMFQARWETKMFQGYDGTLFLTGNRRLVWRHQLDTAGKLNHLEMSDADIQVLPAGLRVFRPRLSFKNAFLEEHAGKLDRSRAPSNSLLEYQSNLCSECGEDGILEYIFKALQINSGYCVDVGAFDGTTFSNTRALISGKKWRGTLIERDQFAFVSLQSLYSGTAGVTTLCEEVSTRGQKSLDALLRKVGAPTRFDFLCIDIEGNDYNIWAALRRYQPAVVMVDFNPSVPNDVLFAQEDSSEVHHGASLRAFIELGRLKGYELAAVTTWNAIFVRNEFFPFLGVSDNSIDKMYYPVFETKVFHSINCYVSTTGCDRLMRHDYPIDPERLQPVPPDVRRISFMAGKNMSSHRSTFFDPRFESWNDEG